MIGRRVVPALASMAIAIGTLSACGSDSGSTPEGGNTPQASPAVQWIDKVCGTLVTGGQKLSQMPAVDPANPAAAKEGLIGFFTSFSDTLTSLSTGLKDAGVPPVADGQATVDKAQATIDGAKTSVDSAKTKLAGIDTANPLAFQQALVELSPSLTALDNTDGPLKDLRANPELNTAFEQAPGCKQVDSESASAAPTS